MINPKVAIIVPYSGLRQAVEEVVAEMKAEVRVLEGDLDEGVTAARQAVKDGAEVIISRGGTAMLIAQSIDIPVVEIKVSPFDMIRCLMKLRDYQGPIGVIGFPNFVYDCESVGRALDIKLRRIIIESREEAFSPMEAAAHEGIRLVIGGVASIHEASKFGMKGVLITSGREAIIQAIQEAMTIAKVRARERERAELLRIVVNSTHEGIMVVDQDERITLMNSMAEKVFGLTASEVLGEKVKDKIPNTLLPQILREGDGEYAELQTVGDKVIVTQRFVIRVNGKIIGAVANFRDITEIQRLEQIVRQKMHTKGLVAPMYLDDLIGSSAEIIQLKDRVKKFAIVNAAVLIMGESGTGKELVAQGIHNSSQRSKGPFVAMNCAALPESLLESELFGYEEGSFTGAKRGGKQGMFELAHGGTIFLDEIGDMPLLLQSKLLRILQDRMVHRIGGECLIHVDVRIIAATNRNLKVLIENGQFREDLYYRLNTLTLFIPPLRQRIGDIGVLSDYFMGKHSHLNARVQQLDPGALRLLEKYQWPGNVRELEHVIERLIIIGEEKVVDPQAVDNLLRELDLDRFWGGKKGALSHPFSLEEMELDFISTVLEDESNNMSKAAKRLGISRSTLWRKLHNQSKLEQ